MSGPMAVGWNAPNTPLSSLIEWYSELWKALPAASPAAR